MNRIVINKWIESIHFNFTVINISNIRKAKLLYLYFI